MTFNELLRDAGQPDRTSWQPSLFEASRDDHFEQLQDLLRRGAVREVHDTYGEQVEELVETRNPSRTFSEAELAAAVVEHHGGRPPERCGAWVFYPWSGRLAHVLSRDEFRELRSNRNRNKISLEEQALLRERTIAVVGLSVGQTSAYTLAMEGVGGRFRLADFDRLSLSNMNRLRGTVCDIGVNKCVLAARQMLELDPFLEIELFDTGVQEDNIDRILGGDRPIDLLVEECDSLHVKVAIRTAARRLRIPVVMETSDRGLLDIERFDLEPERPLFHGLLGEEVDTKALAGLSTSEKLPFVLRILGETAISDRLAGSLFAVADTLKTWPQLGSAVTLGGACVTDVARRILLGELKASGRFYVDLHQIVREGAQAEIAIPQASFVQGPQAVGISLEGLKASRGDTPSPEQVRAIAQYGLMAPSSGNEQPWRFRFGGNRISAMLEPPEEEVFLNYERGATFLAYGAACENMELAAAAMGLRTSLEVFPDPSDSSRVFDLSFIGSVEPKTSDLVEAIPQRATNRRLGREQPLEPADREALVAAAEHHGATLRVVEDREGLEALAKCLGRVDRVAFLNRRMHGEIMSEFRWTSEEAARTRDGIDLATLDLSRPQAAVFRMLAHWPGMAVLKRTGGGASLEKPTREAVLASSAVVVLTVRGSSSRDYFRGGRAMQRVWLRATSRGVWMQPMAMCPYLMARLERGEGEGFDKRDTKQLRAQQEVYRHYFPGGGDDADVMLFRVFYGEPPSTRALRLPIESVLTVDD